MSDEGNNSDWEDLENRKKVETDEPPTLKYQVSSTNNVVEDLDGSANEEEQDGEENYEYQYEIEEEFEDDSDDPGYQNVESSEVYGSVSYHYKRLDQNENENNDDNHENFEKGDINRRPIVYDEVEVEYDVIGDEDDVIYADDDGKKTDDVTGDGDEEDIVMEKRSKTKLYAELSDDELDMALQRDVAPPTRQFSKNKKHVTVEEPEETITRKPQAGKQREASNSKLSTTLKEGEEKVDHVIVEKHRSSMLTWEHPSDDDLAFVSPRDDEEEKEKEDQKDNQETQQEDYKEKQKKSARKQKEGDQKKSGGKEKNKDKNTKVAEKKKHKDKRQITRSKTEPAIYQSDDQKDNEKTGKKKTENDGKEAVNKTKDKKEKISSPSHSPYKSLLLNSEANQRQTKSSRQPYKDSSLHYDTQLFINKHVISLSSPITTESLEREELLYGYKVDKSKLSTLDEPMKTEPESNTYRHRSPYKSKSVVTKPELERLTRDPEELDTPRPVSPPRIPYIPRRSYLYYYPRRYYYPFELYLDNIDLEIKAFERELDLAKFRRPRYYVSPFRLARFYDSIRDIEDVYRKLDLKKPMILPPPPPPPPPPAPTTLRTLPRPYTPKFYTPRYEDPSPLYAVEKRIDKLNERAQSLNSTIKHLRSVWDY